MGNIGPIPYMDPMGIKSDDKSLRMLRCLKSNDGPSTLVPSLSIGTASWC